MMQWPLMITLTMPNSEDPESVREIRKSWSKFRRKKIVKDRVAGGLTAIEVTNNGNGWHPHIHAIIDCEWLSLHTPAPTRRDSEAVIKQKCEMAQLELSCRWADAIGQETAVVWAKRCKDEEALHYSLKYSVKASDLLDCRTEIAPLIRVMERTRLVSAFGSLYGRTAEMDDEEKPCMCCTNCGTEKTIIPRSVFEIITRHDPIDRMWPVSYAEGWSPTTKQKPA